MRRVVVASSDSVVGFHYNPPDWKPQYLPIDERHPLCPTEFYSLSKQVTETICRSYAQRGRLEVVVIRPTHIVFPARVPGAGGARQRPHELSPLDLCGTRGRGARFSAGTRAAGSPLRVLLHLGGGRAEHAADVGAGARALWFPSRDQAPGALRAPADRLGAGWQPGARGAGLRADAGTGARCWPRPPRLLPKPEPECRPWPASALSRSTPTAIPPRMPREDCIRHLAGAGLRRFRADDVSGPSVAGGHRCGRAPRAARPGRWAGAADREPQHAQHRHEHRGRGRGDAPSHAGPAARDPGACGRSRGAGRGGRPRQGEPA